MIPAWLNSRTEEGIRNKKTYFKIEEVFTKIQKALLKRRLLLEKLCDLVKQTLEEFEGQLLESKNQCSFVTENIRKNTTEKFLVLLFEIC